jgi:Fe2+ or Zn2+ uptake regulation protein
MKRKGEAQRSLNSSGRRVTAQRTLLLALLQQSKVHMDAYELYRQARQKYPRISLSTVYRNLQLFKRLRLIDEYHFAEEHHHYEPKPATEHQHLVCLNCGKVVEFAYPMSQKLKQDISKKHDFDVVGVGVNVTGLCSECHKENTKEQFDKE